MSLYGRRIVNWIQKVVHVYPVDLKWLWLVNYHFSWSLKTKCCTLHTYLILLGSVNCEAFIPIFDGVEPQQQRLLELFVGFSARPWSSVNSCSPGGFLVRECSRGLSHVLESPPLRGWDGPALLAWANATRAAKHSFPLGRDWMLLWHCDVSMLPWTSDMDEHWISMIN